MKIKLKIIRKCASHYLFRPNLNNKSAPYSYTPVSTPLKHKATQHTNINDRKLIYMSNPTATITAPHTEISTTFISPAHP